MQIVENMPQLSLMVLHAPSPYLHRNGCRCQLSLPSAPFSSPLISHSNSSFLLSHSSVLNFLLIFSPFSSREGRYGYGVLPVLHQFGVAYHFQLSVVFWCWHWSINVWLCEGRVQQFSRRAGRNIVLRDSDCSAVRSAEYEGGLVVSVDPLRTDELLQVSSRYLKSLVTASALYTASPVWALGL